MMPYICMGIMHGNYAWKPCEATQDEGHVCAADDHQIWCV